MHIKLHMHLLRFLLCIFSILVCLGVSTIFHDHWCKAVKRLCVSNLHHLFGSTWLLDLVMCMQYVLYSGPLLESSKNFQRQRRTGFLAGSFKISKTSFWPLVIYWRNLALECCVMTWCNHLEDTNGYYLKIVFPLMLLLVGGYKEAKVLFLLFGSPPPNTE